MVTVVRLRWPQEADRRAALAGVAPRLLLVDPTADPPPTWAADEDWVRLPADPLDVEHRIVGLRCRLGLAPEPTARRPRLVVDDDGLVHRGDRWVALSPIEAAIVAALVEHAGGAVRRDALAAAAWAGEARSERAVDGVIRRVRPKLAELDVDVHGLAGVGYLLAAA